MTQLRRCSPEIERELHDKEARIRELEAALRDVDEGLLYYVIGIPHLDTPAKMHRLRIKHLLSAAPPDSEPAEGEGDDDAIGYDEVVAWAEEVWEEPRNHDNDTPQRDRDLAAAIMTHLITRGMPDPAEQQDAMLERRDALDALVSVLPEIEFGRETHCKWRDYLRAYPEQIKENPDIGDADFHAQMVETYDARIGAIRKAQRVLSRTSDEGTGCVVPEDRESALWLMARIIERHVEKPPGPPDPPFDRQPEWVRKAYYRRAERALAAHGSGR